MDQDLTELARRMRREWDARAAHDARYFVRQTVLDQDDTSFDESGALNVRTYVAPEIARWAAGRNPRTMRALEIGCGVGRLTRHLAGIFGEVHGLDVSSEMIRLGRERLADLPNVHLHHGNGVDLSGLADDSFQFVFSYIVFQHVPDKAVIASYVREVARVLEPGGLFKFQVHGGSSDYHGDTGSTWSGAVVTQQDITSWAEELGFRVLSLEGFGTQYAWARLEATASGSAIGAAASSVAPALPLARALPRPVRVVVPLFDRRSAPPAAIIAATPEDRARFVWVDCRPPGDPPLVTAGGQSIVVGSPAWTFEDALREGCRDMSEPYWAALSERAVPEAGWLASLVRRAEAAPGIAIVGAPLLRVRSSGHVDRLTPVARDCEDFALWSADATDVPPGVALLGAALLRAGADPLTSRVDVDEDVCVSIFDLEPAFYCSWLWDFSEYYRKAGNLKEAQHHLEELVQRFPDDERALHALERIREERAAKG
jgi:SAM-dependent methyltransferase